MDQDEYLDLVDENDNVIDRKLRSEVHAGKLKNFRAINVFIRNSEGKLWIPRRTAHKQLFPLGLDFSSAGHVQSGDTYEETLRKDLMEELNIDVTKYPIHLLGKVTPAILNTCFAMTYEIQSDETPRYNPDDFIESFWLSPEEVVTRIERGDYAKRFLAPLVRYFYLGSQKNAA
ncbi:NUDIX domain-containing protein [Candidatus Kaiserbacteria bacterium]|nr:NUDIX domain-containing protein [Candidatus Kaiserbacteria bacterium]